MSATAIIQLNPPLWVQTPLGDGRAVVLIDYGPDYNPVFLVTLHDGKHDGRFKSIDTNDCRGMENLTFGITRPAAPTGNEA